MVKRDTKTLARYFTRPSTDSKRRTSAGAKPAGGVITGGGDPPPPVRKPFRIATGTDRIRVVPNGNAAPKVEELPISCVLEVAYEGSGSSVERTGCFGILRRAVVDAPREGCSNAAKRLRQRELSVAAARSVPLGVARRRDALNRGS
jgi:hypothetical protein